MDFLKVISILQNDLIRMKQVIQPGTQLYPKLAQISAVNDPLKLGRIKVLYGDQNVIESDWINVLGVSSGTIPTQFIGNKGIIIFLDGHHEDGIFLGIMPSNSGQDVIKGSPISLPIIDTRALTQVPVCEGPTEGQVMLFSDTESVDLKVCIRNNTISSKDDKNLPPKYLWKSLTNSLVIGKGQYGESNTPLSDVPDTRTSLHWGPCQESLQGERRLFAEDRSLPQAEYTCRKQPGELYAWVPSASPPLYTKENLPRCTPGLVGAMVALDDGKNTELVMCGRKDSTQSKDNLVWIKFVRSFLMSHNGPTSDGAEVTKNEDKPQIAQDIYLQSATPEKDTSVRNNILSQIFNVVNAVESIIDSPNPENIIQQIRDLGIFNQ